MQAIEQLDPDLVVLAVFWFLFGVKVDLLPGCYVHPMLCMLAGINGSPLQYPVCQP